MSDYGGNSSSYGGPTVSLNYGGRGKSYGGSGGAVAASVWSVTKNYGTPETFEDWTEVFAGVTKNYGTAEDFETWLDDVINDNGETSIYTDDIGVSLGVWANSSDWDETGSGSYEIDGDSVSSSPNSININADASSTPVYWSNNSVGNVSSNKFRVWVNGSGSTGANVAHLISGLDADGTTEGADRYELRVLRQGGTTSYSIELYRIVSATPTFLARASGLTAPNGTNNGFWVIAAFVVSTDTYIQLEEAATETGTRTLRFAYVDDSGSKITAAGQLRMGGYGAINREAYMDDVTIFSVP